uniref:Uncharacterized protein n=1 Tax=Magallana gigas TaxID=29159 RepID=A0A8W8IJC7_MAGGI
RYCLAIDAHPTLAQWTNSGVRAEDLHKELVSTRKNLEYRFKAFTGELSTGNIHRRNRVPKI